MLGFRCIHVCKCLLKQCFKVLLKFLRVEPTQHKEPISVQIRFTKRSNQFLFTCLMQLSGTLISRMHLSSAVSSSGQFTIYHQQ